MKRFLAILALFAAMPVFVAVGQRPNTVSQEVVSIDGAEYYVHTVREGETLGSLARVYGVPAEQIAHDNEAALRGEEPRAGQMIRIRCEEIPDVDMTRRQYKRTFDEHAVQPGETAYSIARRYLLSLTTLVADNPGLDPANIRAGEILRIRKAGKGESSPETIRDEVDALSNTLNRLSEEYFYHVVDIGETVYSLSREWGIEENLIRENNDLTGGLRAGMMLKIPVRGHEELKDYYVEEVPLDVDEWQPFWGYAYDGVLNVAMMLPLQDRGIRVNFIEFYQGALLALEDFKASGYSIDFNLYDTERSSDKILRMLRAGELDDADIIIGPVYEEGFRDVARFARRRRIPVVSPLSSLESAYGDWVYQMPPAQEMRYDKLTDIFAGDKNIVIVATDDNDDMFEREMTALIGSAPYQRIHFTKDTPAEMLDSLVVSNMRENVVVVTAGNEVGVDLVLATISSVQNNRKARSRRTAPIEVVGNSRWMRYSVVDRNLFFKLNVMFVTSYHADRSNPLVNNFDKRYIAAFGEVPTLYSYRGYDAVRIFAEAMLTGGDGEDFTEKLNSIGQPLQTRYRFGRNQRGFMENDNWMLVRYRSDYTIEVR